MSVCVWRGGSCGWTCMCMLCGDQRTPWALFPRYGPLYLLRYGLSLLEIGSPPCLLHQDYKHKPPCIAEMFLTWVLEVTLRSLCLQGKFFTNKAISSVYDSILIATFWTTFIILISRLEFKEQLETYPKFQILTPAFQGFVCLKPVASVFIFLPSHPLRFFFTSFFHLFPLSLLASVSIAAMKHPWPKWFREERIYFTNSLSKALRAGTQTEDDPGGRSWCRNHGGVPLTGLFLYDLISLLYYRTQDTPAQGWHHPPWTGLSSN